MPLDPNYDPDSICQAKCTTPLGDPVCRGCGRTFEEVTHWVTYTYEQKMRVVERILLARQDGEIGDSGR